jgi:predicted dithiol-disulfide oxidoreductase (DUF899 family)
MQYQAATKQATQLRKQISELRGKLRDVQKSIEPEPVQDYTFATPEGTVSLADLFGDKEYLFIVHNMGASCPYCTLWADGFNGVLPHLQNRAAFVIASPDEPAKQRKFRDSRGWKFRMVSHRGSNFTAEMGYKGDKGWLPGVSVFKKTGKKIERVSDTAFGPSDDFCAVWHFFDLIPEGAGDWGPKFKY